MSSPGVPSQTMARASAMIRGKRTGIVIDSSKVSADKDTGKVDMDALFEMAEQKTPAEGKKMSPKKILENGADLSTYQGHLGISIEGERIPSLLEIREPKEVKNADFLLQALLDPQAIEREAAQRYSKKKRQGKGKRRKPKR